jgi:hypothetical protein
MAADGTLSVTTSTDVGLRSEKGLAPLMDTHLKSTMPVA